MGLFDNKDIINNVLGDSNIGMWVIDVIDGEKSKMYADDNMIALMGIPESEAADISPEELYDIWYTGIDENHHGAVDEAIKKMAAGNHVEVQYPWNHPNLGAVLVRCGGCVDITFKEGLRFMGFHQDISNLVHIQQQQEQVKVESAYKENVRYMSIASSLSKKYESIYYVNIETDRYTEFNVGGDLRRLPIDNSGNNFFDECRSNLGRVCYKDDLQKMVNFLDKDNLLNSIGYGEFSSIEYRLNIQGKPKFYRVEVVRPIQNKNHIIVAASNINREVKESLKYQEQLTEAMHEAERANKAKTTFLFNVSHDVRTPLNVITGFTDIAKKNLNDAPKVRECLDKIDNASEHLLKLVNEVLDMSNIESGNVEIVEEEIDLLTASEEICSMVKYLAVSKSITFSTRFDIVDKVVFADVSHVNQAMINILTNAVKYTNEGGEVNFAIEQTDDVRDGYCNYRFVVSDNGIGISEDYKQHLFESFSRERSSTLSKNEGLGLGLAITKRLIDKMGGEIEVESEVGEGTTFTITLPFRVTDDEADSLIDGNRNEISLEGKRVLVVEDNELNAEITVEILKEEGMVADIAEDGAQAVRKLRRRGVKKYDLILMDIQMPVMDGYEATRVIRNKIRGGSEIPIVALSANAFERDKMNSIRSGMNEHLSKPVNAEVLYEVIKTQLARTASRQ